MSFDARQWLGRSQRLRHVFSLGPGDGSVTDNRPLGGNTTAAAQVIIPFGKVMVSQRPRLRGAANCARVSLGGVLATVPSLQSVRQETTGAWLPAGSVSINRPLHSFDFPYGRQLGAATYISRFFVSEAVGSTAFGSGFVLFETDGDPANMLGLLAFLGKTPTGYGSRWVQITATRVSKEFTSWPGGRTGISRSVPLAGPSQGLPDSTRFADSSVTTPSVPGELLLIRASEINNGVKTVRAQCLLFNAAVPDSFGQVFCQVSLARQGEGTQCVAAVRSSAGIQSVYQTCHTLTFPYTPSSVDECIFGEFRSSVLRGDMYAGTIPPDGDGEQTIELRTLDHDHVSDVGFRHGLLTLPSPAFGGLRESWQYSEQNERLVLPNVRGLFNESVQTGESPIGELTRSTPMFTWQTVGGTSVKAPTEMRTVRAVCLTSRLHEFEEGRLCDGFQYANATPDVLTIRGQAISGVRIGFTLTGSSGPLTAGQAADARGRTGFVHPVGDYDCEPFSINGVDSAPGLYYAARAQGPHTLTDEEVSDGFNVATTTVVDHHCEVYAVVGVGLQEPGERVLDGSPNDQYASADAPRGRARACVVTVGDAQAKTSLRIDLFLRCVTSRVVTVTTTAVPPSTAPGSTTTTESDSASAESARYLGSVFMSGDQVDELLDGDRVTATKWMEASGEEESFSLSDSPIGPSFHVGIDVELL